MPHTVSARLLGSPQVLIDGADPSVEFLWRKHLAVCLLLWLAPDRTRSRDQLIAMLWPDKPERAARHSLNEALRVIRRSAGDEAVVSVGESVSWRGEVTLDLDSLARTSITTPEVQATQIAGALCEGFSVPDAGAFEEWLEAERRSWSTRCITILTQAARASDDAGDSLTAADFSARALRLDPFSDLAAQAVIRSRWLLGDRGGAIAEGRAFQERLTTALGATPDPATMALLTSISRSARAAVAPPVQAVRRPALVGRRRELDALVESWANLQAAREAVVVIIEGDPGSGRTRLLEEMTARAALDGGTTAVIRAVDADGDAGPDDLFNLLHAAMIEMPGIPAAPPSALASLAVRRGDWADRFPGAAAGTGLPLLDALAAVLRAAGEERPVVLAIDDVERIGPAMLRAVPAMVRSIGNAPVLFLLTMPRGDVGEALDALRRDAAKIVRLDPWTTSEIEAFATQRLGDWPDEARARLARRLSVESGGLPGIAVELLEGVAHGLSLGDEPAHWPAPDRTLDHSLPGPVPGALVAAIRTAFRRLEPEAQALLTTAALVPEPFNPTKLAQLLSDGDIEGLLDRLEWQCWLVADVRGYAFRARRVRQTIADEMLTPGQRQRLLQRIAGA